jgi:hypothetical protein
MLLHITMELFDSSASAFHCWSGTYALDMPANIHHPVAAAD